MSRASVDPAVDAELQAVRARVHVPAGVGEAVVDDFSRTVRHAVGIAVRDEQDVGRCHHPHAPVPDREPHQVLDLVVEHAPGLKLRAAVRVVEDHDAVAERVHEAVAVHRVVLCDPQPAVRVPSQLDGVLHIGLGREHAGLEPGRQLHRGQRLGGRQRRRAGAARHGVGVDDLGELGGAQRGHPGDDGGDEQQAQ